MTGGRERMVSSRRGSGSGLGACVGVWIGVCLLVGACACAADGKAGGPSGAPGTSSTSPAVAAPRQSFTLSAAAPALELPLRSPAAAPPGLALSLSAIANPRAQPFSIRLELRWRDGAEASAVKLDSVSPLPSNEPAAFSISLPKEAAALATRARGRLSLAISLAPISSERPLGAPLSATFAEPRWIAR